MVARNFSLQDLPYNRVLQVQPDEEREFLALDELKPHQLTELGVSVTASSSSPAAQHQPQQQHGGEAPNPVITTGGLLQNYHHHNVFYELGPTQSPSK